MNRGNRFDYERLVLEIYAGLGDVSNDNDMPLPLRTNLGTAINGIENKYRNSDHDINYSLPLFFTWTPACKKLPITKAMATNVQEIWRAAKKAAWVDGKATECDDWINDKLTGTLPVEIKDVDASNEESVPVEENTETADSSSDNSGELVNNISDSISLSRLSEEDNIVGETIWRVMRGGSEDAIYGHDVDGTEATDEDQDSTPSIFLAEPPRWR